ncbi:hypothetical protein, partial [Escherichia coli]|uniref:hypothetical protein n=1 Tax=Escherichia coli TaxID=562 RepID=UPI001AA0C9EF
SINFENSTTANVIKRVEELTDYRFYFAEDWLGDERISGNYKDVTLQVFLDSIFKNTIINYYVSPDNKIILTRSILIYNSLPEGFFNESEKNI